MLRDRLYGRDALGWADTQVRPNVGKGAFHPAAAEVLLQKLLLLLEKG
jgi:hypothetical protein